MKALNAKPTEALWEMIENDLANLEEIKQKEGDFVFIKGREPKHGNCKLSDDDVRLIRKIGSYRKELTKLLSRYSNEELCKIFKVNRSTLQKAMHRKSHWDVK